MIVVNLVGARPQFIKAATVSRALRSVTDVKEIMVHTGQHYDDNMSNVFFNELEISTPEYNLGIGSGSHATQTGRMLEAIEKVLLKVQPDWVLVYGDTNSTLAGALASSKLHLPVAHIEAGLRSFNRKMPEEINRVVTDHVADLLFTPTRTAVDNLQREGITTPKVHLVGDVMYDAALYYGKKAEQESCILDYMNLQSKTYILTTIHRADNTDNLSRLSSIFEGLILISKEIPIIMPLHPRTRKVLQNAGILQKVSQHIQLIDPQGYLDMIMLEKHAKLIATDSGGIQKEAFFHKVPCVTLRDETEWVELVETGWNILVSPTNAIKVADCIKTGLAYNNIHQHILPMYGNGNASELIVKVLLKNKH